MPRKATGNVYLSAGRWYARVTLGPKARPNFALPTCSTEERARDRLVFLSALAARLREAGLAELAPEFLERAADREGKALDDVRQAVEKLCAHGVTGRAPVALTFRQFAEMWTSGELARQYPDHVRVKRSANSDILRLAAHVYPIVGDVPLVAFTLDHAQAVMSELREGLAPATRRHVAQLLNRVLSLATFPARLIPQSPLPRGFLPGMGPGKAKGYLYPDEDARLLASASVPLLWRVFYGFLNREGLRASEALRLAWADLDLARGTITLDENKSDEPRAWALNAGVLRAMRAWQALREAREGALDDAAPVFIDEQGGHIPESHLAARFREHLRTAGIARAELFDRTAARQPIRLHDTRATFITISLANGKTEAWVQDRTGHKSSLMINRYRRAARTGAELSLGDLSALDAALPELAIGGPKGAGNGAASALELCAASPVATKTSIIPRSSPGRGRTDTPLRAADFKTPNGGGEHASMVVSAGNLERAGDRSEPLATPRAASGAPYADSEAPGGGGSTSPRAGALAALAGELGRLSAAGDLEGARVLHATMGHLISLELPRAQVVDLSAERARRR